MAREATVQTQLRVRIGNINYVSNPSNFQATVTGINGPCPGAFAATLEGTDVNFSELTQPGLGIIKNIDSTNFVTVGIWDGVDFFPLMELLPGEFFPIRFSRYLTQEFMTGTGTTGGGNTVRIKADTAPAKVVVEAFEA